MKDMKEYYKAITNEKGEQVALGFDIDAYGTDMGKELYRFHAGNAEAFRKGFLQAFAVITLNNKKNESLTQSNVTSIGFEKESSDETLPPAS